MRYEPTSMQRNTLGNGHIDIFYFEILRITTPTSYDLYEAKVKFSQQFEYEIFFYKNGLIITQYIRIGVQSKERVEEIFDDFKNDITSLQNL